MGYQRSTLILKFEDEEYAELEVKMRRLPLGDLLAVSELADMGKDLKDHKAALDDLLSTVAGSLLSWNLEDEKGEPVLLEKGHERHKAKPGCCERSAGPEVLVETVWHASTGLYSLDLDFTLDIVNAWVESAAGVSRPLPKNSNSGSTSLEEFEQMVASLESQEPSSMPN